MLILQSLMHGSTPSAHFSDFPVCNTFSMFTSATVKEFLTKHSRVFSWKTTAKALTRKQHLCALFRNDLASQLSGHGSQLTPVYWHCLLLLKHSCDGLIIEQSAAWDPWVCDGPNVVHFCFCINTSVLQSSAKYEGIISQIASQRHNVLLGYDLYKQMNEYESSKALMKMSHKLNIIKLKHVNQNDSGTRSQYL